MSDGSITIVDLKEQKVIGSVDTLKNKGYNPNSIVLLPKVEPPGRALKRVIRRRTPGGTTRCPQRGANRPARAR